ncbi:hypothetical protein MHYP_G00019650 [Metynnis hypsauchen]
MNLLIDGEVTGRLREQGAVASKEDRKTILFTHHIKDQDELNVWQEKGNISLYLRSSSVTCVSPGSPAQDADSFLDKFEINQSFVGEISDVNMWDYVLTGNQIRNFSEKVWVGPAPNVLHWNTMQYEVKGNVIEVPKKYK